MAGEKTEKATPKRKEEERKKGNIFQSKEVIIVASLVIMFYSFKALAPFTFGAIKQSMVDFLSLAATKDILTVSDMRRLFLDSTIIFAKAALPILLIGGLTAIVFTAVQTRMLVSTKNMAFKFSRLNPLQGIKKMFSIRSLTELLKALVKIGVLGYIIYRNFSDKLGLFPRFMLMEPIQSLGFLEDFILSIVKSTATIFIFLAGFDYFYQWWDYEKNLRMSKQDIKDEYKQTEGDPQVKGQIKEKQRQRAMSRMMQNVPKADVIIRNPTHYAIALQYDPEKNNAPIIVAKGADYLALRIIKVAEEHDIVITENKPLARALYAEADLNTEIPAQFYQAVAEVLAFVYSLKKKDWKQSENI